MKGLTLVGVLALVVGCGPAKQPEIPVVGNDERMEVVSCQRVNKIIRGVTSDKDMVTILRDKKTGREYIVYQSAHTNYPVAIAPADGSKE